MPTVARSYRFTRCEAFRDRATCMPFPGNGHETNCRQRLNYSTIACSTRTTTGRWSCEAQRAGGNLSERRAYVPPVDNVADWPPIPCDYSIQTRLSDTRAQPAPPPQVPLASTGFSSKNGRPGVTIVDAIKPAHYLGARPHHSPFTPSRFASSPPSSREIERFEDRTISD